MNQGYFKLGLFVAISVALLVCFLLTLGVMERFRPRVMVETYFNESIQGLQRGAEVRFRGLKVGNVHEIGFASSVYEEAVLSRDRAYVGGLIRVAIALDVATLARARETLTPSDMAAAVDRGLRTRLATSGIGGPRFVDVDYVNPETFPEPDLPWTPEYAFVPSMPSTVGSIVTSLASILRQVEERSVIEHLATLSERLDAIFEDFDESELYTTSIAALGELRGASAEAHALLADPRIGTILDDAGATLDGARTLLDRDRGSIEPLIGELSDMAGSLDRAAVSLDTLAAGVNESDLIEDLRTLADDLGPAGRDLSELAGRIDRLVKGNEGQIADTIRSLRDAVGELQALLEELKANPSRVLSRPPPRRNPGTDR